MSDNNLFNINVGILIGIFINNQIDNNAVIMTDSGWECDETEVNMVYYNDKKKMSSCLLENTATTRHMKIVMIGNFCGFIRI